MPKRGRKRKRITENWRKPASFRAVAAFLESTNTVTKARSQDLAYEVQEILACCEHIPAGIERFARTLARCKEALFDADAAVLDLLGHLEHIRRHAVLARKHLCWTSAKVRKLPPLNTLDEHEIVKLHLQRVSSAAGGKKRPLATHVARRVSDSRGK
jgi:hypothetical protein